MKSVHIRSYFWSVCSCIWTEYWYLRSGEIRTRNNSVFGHFSRSGPVFAPPENIRKRSKKGALAWNGLKNNSRVVYYWSEFFFQSDFFINHWFSTLWERQDYQTILRKKWSFPLMTSSVNVTKSEVSCGFGLIYWRSPEQKTSFFMQCNNASFKISK